MIQREILVPVDFSNCSKNALLYAMGLARVAHRKVVVMHSYLQPVAIGSTPQSFVDEVDAGLYQEMQQLLLQLKKEFVAGNEVPYDELIEEGHLIQTTRLLLDKRPIDLIVMGTRGASGLTEHLGSNAYSMIRETNFPVIVVPQKAKFTGLKNIAFASDFQQTGRDALSPLTGMAKIHNAEIHILHMGTNGRISAEEIQAAKVMERLLKNTHHSYHYENAKDIIKSIKAYSDTNKVDLIAVLARRHSFIEKLTERSITKGMVVQTNLPLLVMPETKSEDD